jgi:formylmethanofuran dehydrogenase subunit E
MRSMDELLRESSTLHGHFCAGKIVGVRMAMVGCREVDIEEPKGCKKLIVCVEMDRCATDAIQAVTGCSLGSHNRLCPTDKNLIALVKAPEGVEAVPTFASESTKPLADFIEAKILTKSRGTI